MRVWSAALACVLALGAGELVQAQGSKVSSAAELARRADTLKPGQWIWAPDSSPTGTVIVYVDLSRQLATVYRNGVRIAVSTISSGKPGYETPTGVFQILQKDKDHRSNTYDNAPMPYQERLTWDGVALHAGGLPGYPESHGCIHLPYQFAKLLFGTTSMGGTVIVAGRHGDPIRADAAGVLAPAKVSDHTRLELTEGQAYRWHPELSPKGPISVVISRTDHQAVVLRNGVEIGRAHATIDGDSTGVRVATLTTSSTGAPQWVMVGVPGNDADAGRPVDANELDRLRVPHGFMEDLQAVMTPGSTVLVTDSPVTAQSTGEHLTVLSDDGPTGEKK
ncbi:MULTISPECIES: L,D-transpeptidase [Phenylobacterium]|uniref:L,D-TPase catalytic domain-containing protein n=1 Tax=Phenylobacterium koreense TaxID=266125 RepID=A0ABV2EGA8_9CAUL